MIDSAVFENAAQEAIFASFENNELLDNSNFGQTSRDLVAEYQNDIRTQPVLFSGTDLPYENRLASWVSPLHFERNLSNALDALSACEQILMNRLQVQGLGSGLIART